MNRKILLSVLALPISVVIAFLLGVIVLAILNASKANSFSNLQLGYGMLLGAAIIYLVSLVLIWTGRLFRPSSGQETVEGQSSPWSALSVFIFSILFGPGASYLITWQNLKRIGKTDVTNSFLGLGGVALLAIVIIIYILPEGIAKVIGDISAIIFPIWLYHSYQKKYQFDNPKRAKFSWSILGWSCLGVILILAIFILVGAIWKK